MPSVDVVATSVDLASATKQTHKNQSKEAKPVAGGANVHKMDMEASASSVDLGTPRDLDFEPSPPPSASPSLKTSYIQKEASTATMDAIASHQAKAAASHHGPDHRKFTTDHI